MSQSLDRLVAALRDTHKDPWGEGVRDCGTGMPFFPLHDSATTVTDG
ncbi:hypothetical protein OG226_02060 [Streptomyces sp. NBC_01261]|nr:hypothetical protein [Streptomyces sp. NBC_01261]